MGAGASSGGDFGGDHSHGLPDFSSASEEQRALMIQAQANWHRMIVHANSKGKLSDSPSQVTNINNNTSTDSSRASVGSKTLRRTNTTEEEEKRVERTIALFKDAESKFIQDHKSRENVEDIEKVLVSRFEPLDESAIIARANSDIVLKRSPTGLPLPIMDKSNRTTSSSSIKNSKSGNNSSSSNLISGDEKDDLDEKDTIFSPQANSSYLSPYKNKNNTSDVSPQRKITSECLRAISLLPPVRVDLRSRTGTSLSLVWDTDMEALISLKKVVDRDGVVLVPRYEVQYRKAQGSNDIEALYELYDFENVLGKWQSLELSDESSNKGTIEKLEPNTQYSVRCRRMQWSEEWGVTVTVRTGPGPPSKVENLHAKEVSSSSILVAWDLPMQDNGLPILYYVVQKKRLGGEFEEVFKGKERLYLALDLAPNAVYIFEVVGYNRAGLGAVGDRLATRTLQPGAPAMTPWMEMIETKTGKLFYKHPKTEATAWSLPKGSVVDRGLSLQNKIAYLRGQIKSMQALARQELPPDKHQVKLSISRDNILEESLRLIRIPSPAELLAGPLKVTFLDEVGVDGGGLSREWAVELMKALAGSTSGLLKAEDNGGGVLIDVRAETFHGAECRWLFSAIAKYFAKIIIDGLVIGVRFNKIFLSWLTAKQATLADLQSMDSTMYKGLMWVLENDVTDMDLTFSASFELFDAQQTVNLVPGGASKTVTEGNKREYVDLMMAWLLRGRFEPAVTHFVNSFHGILPITLFEHFSLSDLQLLISGSPEVDVPLLKHEACYTGGYSEGTPQVQWFWEILQGDLSGQDVSALLAFVTGCPCVPHTGLKPPLTITLVENAMTMTESTSSVVIEPLTVATASTTANTSSSGNATVVDMEKRDEVLPRSHTCFHQIVMPLYSSKEKMLEKLMYAIRNSDGGGFHLA